MRFFFCYVSFVSLGMPWIISVTHNRFNHCGSLLNLVTVSVEDSTFQVISCHCDFNKTCLRWESIYFHARFYERERTWQVNGRETLEIIFYRMPLLPRNFQSVSSSRARLRWKRINQLSFICRQTLVYTKLIRRMDFFIYCHFVEEKISASVGIYTTRLFLRQIYGEQIIKGKSGNMS